MTTQCQTTLLLEINDAGKDLCLKTLEDVRLVFVFSVLCVVEESQHAALKRKYYWARFAAGFPKTYIVLRKVTRKDD